ncbi:MAG TPA: hypothetical protein VKV05_01710 [Terriglobales bacterium]|nr:hypothetical protein [Terriglobales bacterium]
MTSTLQVKNNLLVSSGFAAVLPFDVFPPRSRILRKAKGIPASRADEKDEEEVRYA